MSVAAEAAKHEGRFVNYKRILPENVEVEECEGEHSKDWRLERFIDFDVQPNKRSQQAREAVLRMLPPK